MTQLDLTPIIEAVRLSAKLALEVQQRHIVRSEKTGAEPVTIADYGAQAIICRAIQKHFPDDGVMAEESGSEFLRVVEADQRAYIVSLVSDILGEAITESHLVAWLDHAHLDKTVDEPHRVWVIDPIDGTKGFLAQRHYVNAVGLMEGRKPIAGVLAAPAYPTIAGGNLLYAVEGVAYAESLIPNNDKRVIRVSDRVDVATLRALESVEKGHAGLARLARVREIMGMTPTQVEQADSMEKYGRIAAGDADLYLRLPRLGDGRPHNIWDHAPGTVIVEAAGGKITDVDGSPIDYSRGTTLNNYGVIATNGKIHDLALSAVATLLEEEKQHGDA
jgi:3'(2'), 5'-bisphosphate nucleotidase